MANTIKAYFYVGLVTFLFTLIGLATRVPRWELSSGWPYSDWVVFLNHQIYPWSFTILGFLIGAILCLIAYRGDSHLLRWCKAERFPNSKYPHVSKILEQMRQRFKMPYPRLFLIRSKMFNAAALGRRPSEGKIMLTQGLVEGLTDDELAGVIAHELSLIKSRQTLVNTIAAMWTAYFLLPAQWALKLPLERIIEDEGQGSNVVATVLYWIATLPFGVLTMHLAITRQRLYEADLDAAGNCELYKQDERGNPAAYLQALRKSHRLTQEVHDRLSYLLIPAVGPLFFVDPFSTRVGVGIYHTHPPIDDRWHKVHDVSEAVLKRRLINIYDERVKDRTDVHIREEDQDRPEVEPDQVEDEQPSRKQPPPPRPVT